MKKEESLEAFSEMPVPQAVMKNAIPAMIAMLMVLIYNLADTFFIGQIRYFTGDRRRKDRVCKKSVFLCGSPCCSRFCWGLS